MSSLQERITQSENYILIHYEPLTLLKLQLQGDGLSDTQYLNMLDRFLELEQTQEVQK